MKMNRVWVTFLASFISLMAYGQLPISSEAFNKNRVQYRNFRWQYLVTANFEVHFYGSNEAIARHTAEVAENEYRRVTRLIGFSPYNKVKIFLYASVSDLQQSNLGVADQDFALGGQTNFNKSVVELAYTGERQSYRDELVREITDALLFEMMYGGNLKEVLQSSYLLSLPEWFIAGASAYVTESWSREMDDFVRAHVADRRFDKPDLYQGEDARHLGHSIWNFIAMKYGRTALANVLNLTRIVRNERTAIQNSLGVPYNDFIRQWQGFYAGQYKALAQEHKPPPAGKRLRDRKNERIYHQVKLSPDAKYVAYSENYRGWYRVWIELAEPGKQKRKKALRGGHYVINQKINEHLPLIDWQNANKLVMLSKYNGKTALWTYDLEEDEEKRISFEDFENIQHMAFNEKGSLLVMSAERNGQSDIYTYDMRSRRLNRLTNDIYDDLDPVFLAQSDTEIAFVSNRPSDKPVPADSADVVSRFFNLFFLDQYSGVEQATNFASQDAIPLAANKDFLLYLSDQRGIRHLFRYDFADQTSHQLTSFMVDIQQYDFVKDKLVTVQQTNEGDQIFLFTDFDLNQTTFTGKTSRQTFMDRLMLEQRRQSKTNTTQAEEKAEGKKETPTDTTKLQKQSRPEPGKTTTDSTINTDDYEFDTFSSRSEPRPKLNNRTRSEEQPEQQAKTPQKGEPQRKKEAVNISGPYTYESLFSFDQSVISPYFDAFRNLGLFLEVGMADDLEHHRIDVGVFFQGLLSINNGYLFAEYEYLKNRLDYRIRYDRQAISLFDPLFIHRYTLNKITGSVSYPLNVVSRVTLSPFVATTRFTASSEVSPLVQALPDQTVLYGGASAEFMLDNTIITAPNIRSGSRLKAELIHYFGLDQSEKGFGNLSIDARHYRELIRGVNLAVRLAYGQFYGRSSQNKQYRLGGVSNWVFQREEETRPDDPFFLDENDPEAFRRDLSDVLFLQYATPLRGFDYNKLAGNNFILFNAELRIPLIAYFNRKTIRSKFFQNLQLVGFTDIGSAWTGISPFNRENALNTVRIENGPFQAKVSNFKDPFLIGYGVGVRTKILNYFTRFDVAWGLEDDAVQPAKYYLSLGYDF